MDEDDLLPADEHADLIGRLRSFGAAPLPPGVAARSLDRIRGNAGPRGRLLPVKVLVAATAGALVFGGVGLAAADVLPAPVQDVAHTTLDRVGVHVPPGHDRYNDPAVCPGGPYRNHGAYVRAHKNDPAAGKSPCGKPVQSVSPSVARRATTPTASETSRSARASSVGTQQEQEQQEQEAARIRRQERHEGTRRHEPARRRAETAVNLDDDHVARHEHDDRVHVDDRVPLDDEHQLAVNVRAVTSFDRSPIDASADCSGAGPADVETIFRRLAGPVHSYLRASGAVDSEDLLGEVFFDVARGLHRFHGDDDALRRWVFTIAHRRLVDEQRRMHRRRHFLRTQTPRVVPPPDEPLDPALMSALDSLTPDQREVVVLRFVADLTLETVAEMTNRPVGAVKSLQHRALHNLASTLDRTPISGASALRSTRTRPRPEVVCDRSELHCVAV